MSQEALFEHVPLSREDSERVELANLSATELDNLRLGRIDQIYPGIIRLITWLEENFSSMDSFDPGQILYVYEALCKSGLFERTTRAIPQLLQAIAYVEIILRGIIAEPASAQRSLPTIEKMHDFCLALARASGRHDF